MEWISKFRLLFKNTGSDFLKKDYFLFLSSILFVVFILSGFVIYNVYHSYVGNTQKNLEVTSKRVDYILSDIFNETNRLMVYIGKQIAIHDDPNLKFIEYLLKNTSGKEYKTKYFLSWTLFDWVGANNLQLINRITGISSNPSDMSHRSYTWKSSQNPWTLQLSEPAIGEPSNMWVIPAGMGVTNKSGTFLGTLVVGFDVDELKKTLVDKLSIEKYGFIVLDENSNVILEVSQDLPDQGKTPKNTHEPLISEALFKKFEHNGITYVLREKMKEYPFTILTGYNTAFRNQEFYSLVLPSLMEIVAMGLFSFALLHVSRKRIITLGKKSDQAKEDFIMLVHEQLKSHINIVLGYSQTLIRFLKGEIEVGISKERQLAFISSIYESALHVKNFTSKSLNLTLVDVNHAIDQSINMYGKKILERNITIKKTLEKDLPYLEADELCMKQIISGLLGYAIDYGPLNSTVWISTALQEVKNRKVLVLIIRDNGFGLTEDDIERIKIKLEPTCFNLGFIEQNFDFIVKLIELHHGTYFVENKAGKGRMVEIILPYSNHFVVSKRKQIAL